MTTIPAKPEPGAAVPAVSPDLSSPTGTGIALASQRLPSRRARLLFSSPSWLGGMLLFACMFLPLMKGCDSDIYPYEALGDTTSAASFLDGLWWTSPYFFGALTGLGALVAAVTGDWRVFRWWWRGYVAVATMLAVGYWAAIGAELRRSPADPLSLLGSRWLPLLLSVVITGLLWLSYRNGRTWVGKAAVLQFAFAIGCLSWFLFWAYALWSDDKWDLRYGGVLSILACGLLLAGAVLQWRNRRRLSQAV